MNRRPVYRYLEPVEPSRVARGYAWALLLAVPAWVLILAAGFLIAHSF